MLFEKNTNREKLISAAAKTFGTIRFSYSIWKVTLLAGLDQCWHTQQCFDQIIRGKAEITKKISMWQHYNNAFWEFTSFQQLIKPIKDFCHIIAADKALLSFTQIISIALFYETLFNMMQFEAFLLQSLPSIFILTSPNGYGSISLNFSLFYPHFWNFNILIATFWAV